MTRRTIETEGSQEVTTPVAEMIDGNRSRFADVLNDLKNYIAQSKIWAFIKKEAGILGEEFAATWQEHKKTMAAIRGRLGMVVPDQLDSEDANSEPVSPTPQ